MSDETAPKQRRRRWRVWWLAALGAAFLFGFFLLSISLVEFTASTPFCSTCHIMAPEVTAYSNSPHARTDCGTCHRGPGAWPLVKAEAANIRYLWVYPLKLYDVPIGTPIHSLRPVEIVCEQCHWPQKFYEDRLVTLADYAVDDANSLTQTALLLKTGGGTQAEGRGRGIHWHIENPVWYIATDEDRQEIPWVRAEFGGLTTEYLSADSTLSAEELSKLEPRKMDCVDCHNRATHVFQRPSEALDEAMKSGEIPADLPYIKQKGVEVLEATYQTEQDAANAITAVQHFYRVKHPEIYNVREDDVKQAVAGLQAIFDKTQFPFMQVTWETHANNIGHKDFPGCFRCHDGKHLSADNQAIRLECNICHNVPQVAGPGEELPPLSIAARAEPDSHRSSTWLAEHRFNFDATCSNCHSVENPGGSDNSSFCSNSACHATEWKFVGLDAPKIRAISEPPQIPNAPGVPAEIPHPIGPTTDCSLCHGPGKVLPAPDDHSIYTAGQCTTCHTPSLTEPGAATTTLTPVAIPHPVTGRENCLECHDPGGGVRPAPQDHAGRAVDTCQACHKPAAGAQEPVATATPAGPATPRSGAPEIPHSLDGRTNCLQCHDPGSGLKPAPQDHVGRAADTCQTCHRPAAGAQEPAATATPAGPATSRSGAPEIPHSLDGRANCLQCHDPDGRVEPAPPDHAGRSADTCQTCHKPEA